MREVGPDYADLADREPLLSALSGVFKTGLKIAGKAASVAG